ncbi:ubiquinone/menaquinone biosynthesis C-methyltransferase UbiE [Aliidongia dinghuensis]|uniref:Ubiquinone/menaquinone biosynthesis C-methyltransferase UbiE n=1 Tax=Aliidongia dinghuensis TaxID=1867774 RepID=A0A8J2Z0I2_9PROT|nr:class I SAM-dependent methyltransferase [Aliidongia dinghuensis]GGF46869.1 ubiquinone/menaquinone biosynthesis C-methyltransferase UbiE [Aliidongia dinghuensis]
MDASRDENDAFAARATPQFVRALFNDTAPHYDTINAIFSLGSGGWYRRRCLRRAGLKPGHRVLDVAIGTGLIAAAAHDIVGPDGDIIGLDLSEAMLAEARRKLDIPLIQGLADQLPLAAATVDLVVMGYAIRHIDDLDACFREFRRVLKPGGILLLLEVSSPTKPIYRTTLAQYLGRAVPVLSRWITRQPKIRALMAYHWETMENCVLPAVIEQTMVRAGFSDVVCEGWFDLFRSYAGQRR